MRDALRWAALLLGLSILVLAEGEAVAGTVALVVGERVEAQCPTREGVREGVGAILGFDPFADGIVSPRIEVRFPEEADGFTAEVMLVGAPGFRGARRLDPPREACHALAEPLAFVIAMAIEDAGGLGALTPTRRPGDMDEARASRRDAAAPALAAPSEAVRGWEYALGPAVVGHLLESPGPSIGGGLTLRLARGRLAWVLGLRASRSLGAEGVAGTVLLAETHGCLVAGALDLCLGLAGGAQRFDATRLVALAPPALVGHVAPTLSVAARVESEDLIFRPSIELGVPLIAPRVTEAEAVLFAPAGVTLGLRFALLFRMD